MENINTSFPKIISKYMKAEEFQDREVLLTFRGWKKKANEDDSPTKKGAKTWKEKLKYQLRYSYPEWALDEAGEQRLDKEGNPFKNANYDPAYPKGYSIIYLFDDCELESGSLPLWKKFCMCSPKPGEELVISRTGSEKETEWFVKRASGHHKDDVPVIQIDDSELKPDEEVPF